MNELALFAGAGGGILGGKLLGWKTVCAVEIDYYCACVLMQRQNDGQLPIFPIWDDVRTFDGKPWRGIVDVISCGYPCQPFSTASRGAQCATDLWPEAFKIIKEILPSVIFAENVAENTIRRSAEQLCEIGYFSRIAKIGADDLGSDHIRKRYWLFAYANNKSEFLRGINAKMEKLPIVEKNIWKSNPRNTRVSNGMAHRMERNSAIGNGQVPAVAATAWKILTEKIED